MVHVVQLQISLGPGLFTRQRIEPVLAQRVNMIEKRCCRGAKPREFIPAGIHPKISKRTRDVRACGRVRRLVAAVVAVVW